MRRVATACIVILGSFALTGCESAKAPGVFQAESVAPPPSVKLTQPRQSIANTTKTSANSARRPLSVPR